MSDNDKPDHDDANPETEDAKPTEAKPEEPSEEKPAKKRKPRAKSKKHEIPDSTTYRFGKLLKSMREARGLTQETLAERSTLSSDTIRRAEWGNFSPSLRTIAKFAHGLSISLSSLFQALDLNEVEPEASTAERVARLHLTRAERVMALHVLEFLILAIRQAQADAGDDESDEGNSDG